MIELIDSHAHLSYNDYAESLEAVLARSKAAGVTRWMAVGTSYENCLGTLALADRYEGMRCVLGVHPHEAQHYRAEQRWAFTELLGRRRAAAVGEIGLDYHYDLSPREAQRAVFEEFLGLADEAGKPVVVHCREAMEDCLAILKAWGKGAGRVLFHCFSGTWMEAKVLLDLGYYVSFSGIVTFKNARDLQDTARRVPNDRFLMETDCPYLSPDPKRGVKPNEPSFLVYTAAALARLRDCPLEEIAQVTRENCRCFFGSNVFFDE